MIDTHKSMEKEFIVTIRLIAKNARIDLKQRTEKSSSHLTRLTLELSNELNST